MKIATWYVELSIIRRGSTSFDLQPHICADDNLVALGSFPSTIWRQVPRSFRCRQVVLFQILVEMLLICLGQTNAIGAVWLLFSMLVSSNDQDLLCWNSHDQRIRSMPDATYFLVLLGWSLDWRDRLRRSPLCFIPEIMILNSLLLILFIDSSYRSYELFIRVELLFSGKGVL